MKFQKTIIPVEDWRAIRYNWINGKYGYVYTLAYHNASGYLKSATATNAVIGEYADYADFVDFIEFKDMVLGPAIDEAIITTLTKSMTTMAGKMLGGL